MDKNTKIQCIRPGKTKGLTDGKYYEVLKFNNLTKMVRIKNDINIIQEYKLNRFN